ncbi:MAG TPA: hypothetical protein VI479_20270 [Blastocatellia bacterium]
MRNFSPPNLALEEGSGIRRGLVQDLQRYGGPKTLMRFFDHLRMRGMVDHAIAAAVEKDLRHLAGFTPNTKEQTCH